MRARRGRGWWIALMAGRADITRIRCSFQKHDLEAGMTNLAINRTEGFYMPLGTIINYNRLDKDMIGNVMELCNESTSAFPRICERNLPCLWVHNFDRILRGS
jgi:hypothetical protein